MAGLVPDDEHCDKHCDAAAESGDRHQCKLAYPALVFDRAELVGHGENQRQEINYNEIKE